jgi:perosamine synthetase
MVSLGFNYRLTDIACALGLSQLLKLKENLERRREIAAAYEQSLGGMRGLILPSVREGVEPAWHLYPIRVDVQELQVNRAEVFRALRAENIGVNVHYIPIHLHPYYREQFGYRGGEYPVAENSYENLISLPMSHGMSDQDASDVIEAVTKTMSFFAA